MEGGFFDELRQLEFFPGAEKQPHSCVPVVSSTVHISNSDPTNQGIYQDEESVDFSALLEPYNSDHPVSSCDTSIATSNPTVSSANSVVYQNIAAPDSNFDSFQGFLSPSLVQHNMYGSESFVPHLHENQIDVLNPNSPSSMVVNHSSQQHVIDNISMGGGYVANQNHPAPGKSPRSKLSKKLMIDKKSEEYLHKRERNNVAVRKSRAKSKIRVVGTEKRVRELEEENNQLQSKITLLTKELNVLKNLFTSVGVAHPLHSAKDERVGQK